MKKGKKVIKFLEWDYLGWKKREPYFGSQNDWDQTLNTKINQAYSILLEKNKRSKFSIRYGRDLFNIIKNILTNHNINNTENIKFLHGLGDIIVVENNNYCVEIEVKNYS